MPSCLLLDTLRQEHVPDSLPTLLSPRAAYLGHAPRALPGHYTTVEALIYSPDGARIVSSSHSSTIRIWSAITFEELGRMDGHTGWVNSLVFSPDGSRIVSGSEDCTVRIWNAEDLGHIVTLQGHHRDVTSVAVSPDGTRIISGSWDNTVRVWCASSFSALECLNGDGHGILCVAYSPKGDRMLASCRDTVHVFDAVSLQCLAQLEATIHKIPMSVGLFRDVVFSHDGVHILAGTRSGTVRVWCAVTFQEIATMDQEVGSVDWIATSSDGAFLLSGNADDGRIHVWNQRTLKVTTRVDAHRWGVTSAALSPDGTHVVSGGVDGALRVWVTGLFDGSSLHSQPRDSPRHISSLAFSASGTHMISRSQEGKTFREFDYGQPSTVRVWNANHFEELGQIEHCSLFAFSPDGSRAVVHHDGVSLSIWNLSPLEKISNLQAPQFSEDRRLASIVYSSDGTRIVCGMSGGNIETWSAVSLARLGEFGAHSSSVLDVMFLTNSTRLVSRSASDGIRFWHADTWEKLGEIPLHEASIQCMAVSPLGTHVVAGLRDKTVRVWSAVTFEALVKLQLDSEGHLLPEYVAFSPDERSVMSLGHRDRPETRAWTCSESDNCALSLSLLSFTLTDVDHVAVWTEAPLSAVQLPTEGTSGAFGVSLSVSGWLHCWIHSQHRLIWLPHDRQSNPTWTAFACRDEHVAVMSHSGTLTMLRFPTGHR
jgi:WD40 repeat protein